MSKALARRFKQDVSVDGTSWVPLLGVTDFNPQETATLQSTDDYDTDGFTTNEKTMTGAKTTTKVQRPIDEAGVFDPGQELCRATQFQFGDAARIYHRWYDRNGADEAYQQRAIVDWNRSKSGAADVEEITITFTSDGVVAAIDNPFADTAVPVITSVASTPTAQVAGGQVEIHGAGFKGTIATSGVKFGATNATSWRVVSDSVIVAVLPAGSAGSAAVVVTNAVGASIAFPYTRGS